MHLRLHGIDETMWVTKLYLDHLADVPKAAMSAWLLSTGRSSEEIQWEEFTQWVNTQIWVRERSDLLTYSDFVRLTMAGEFGSWPAYFAEFQHRLARVQAHGPVTDFTQRFHLWEGLPSADRDCHILPVRSLC